LSIIQQYSYYEEFADWIDGKHSQKTVGGHPWEIKRGGNTTHIARAESVMKIDFTSQYHKDSFIT